MNTHTSYRQPHSCHGTHEPEALHVAHGKQLALLIGAQELNRLTMGNHNLLQALSCKKHA